MNKKQKEIALAVGLAVGLAFIGFLMFLKPALAKRAALTHITPTTITTPSSPVIQADAETAAAAQRAIPAQVSFAQVQRDLTAIAKTYRITLSLTDTSAGVPKGVAQQLMVNGTASGNWANLLPFLIKIGTMTAFDDSHQIRSSGELYLIPNLSLAPKSAQSQLYIASFKLVVPARQ